MNRKITTISIIISTVCVLSVITCITLFFFHSNKRITHSYDELSKDLIKIEYSELQDESDDRDFVAVRILGEDEVEYVLNELSSIEFSLLLGNNPPSSWTTPGTKAIVLYYPTYKLIISEYEISTIHFNSTETNSVERKFVRYNDKFYNLISTIEKNNDE